MIHTFLCHCDTKQLQGERKMMILIFFSTFDSKKKSKTISTHILPILNDRIVKKKCNNKNMRIKKHLIDVYRYDEYIQEYIKGFCS